MNPTVAGAVVLVLAIAAAMSSMTFLKSTVSSQENIDVEQKPLLVGNAVRYPVHDVTMALETKRKETVSKAKKVTVSSDSSKANTTASSVQTPEVPLTGEPNTISYINNTGLDALARDFFGGSTCKTFRGNDTTIEAFSRHMTIVNVSFSCQKLFQESVLGTGNFISAFYTIRMAAHALGTTDVILHCFDAEETKSALILPWLMGKFPTLEPGEEPDEAPTQQQACSDYKSVPVGFRWKDMVFDMRRMAIAMVGIPSPDHPSAKWAEDNLWISDFGNTHKHGRDEMQLAHPQKGDDPLFPDVQLDDAVLHFRCGDIIASNHPSFGFMKFGSFSRHISAQAKRIGIVTQPFTVNAQKRNAEGGAWKMERCKLVVYSFVEHLQKRFPDAEVSIHNDANETIALTFARMIMANQTVIGITSFGVFPGVTTFGSGYIRKPDYIKAPNRWLLTSPIVERVNDLYLVEEPRLMAGPLKRMWGRNGSAVLDWFNTYPNETLVSSAPGLKR